MYDTRTVVAAALAIGAGLTGTAASAGGGLPSPVFLMEQAWQRDHAVTVQLKESDCHTCQRQAVARLNRLKHVLRVEEYPERHRIRVLAQVRRDVDPKAVVSAVRSAGYEVESVHIGS